MKTNISDYIQVFEKLDELGCSYSGGIAILPENFETATPTTSLKQLSQASTIKKLFRSNGIPYSEIRQENEKPGYIQHHAFEWVGPTLFVSAALLSTNPEIISVLLGITANYLTDFFKGFPEKKKVKLDMVVETPSGTCKRISCEGNADELTKLDDLVEKIGEVLNE
jgi:hypothetical protein